MPSERTLREGAQEAAAGAAAPLVASGMAHEAKKLPPIDHPGSVNRGSGPANGEELKDIRGACRSVARALHFHSP